MDFTHDIWLVGCIPLMEYSMGLYFVIWGVEFTDEFGVWRGGLSEVEPESVAYTIGLLEALGPNLGHPHSSGINGWKHSQMRELRIQHQGEPYRALYAFDPLRNEILLIGGKKMGDNRWYDRFAPVADRLYDGRLKALIEEGLWGGKKVRGPEK